MATTTEQSNKALVLGRRFQRALMQADLYRPARRRCGCWPTSTFLQRNGYRNRSEFSGKAKIGQALEQTICLLLL